MRLRFLRLPTCFVRVLTLGVMAFSAGCSTLQLSTEEDCKYHAYLRTPLDIYVMRRFPKGAPVRLGVIPFSVPANLSNRSDQFPGMGAQLAWRVKEQLLGSGVIPIVEILDRKSWPSKRSEFHSGNFEAIGMARDAGYDLVFVGHIEQLHSLTSLTGHGKIIETESGTTVWSGSSTVSTNRHDREKMRVHSWFLERTPNKVYSDLLINELAMCLGRNALDENPAPM